MKTFVITRHDIESFLTMDMVIEAVEEAYVLNARNKVHLPPVLSIDVSQHNGEVDIKSGYERVDDIIGVKLASGHYSNPENYGLPTGMATILLVNAKNGMPLAVMDGGLITDMRTGAAGAVSAKYLARPDAKKVAVLGTGMQARMQILAMSRVFSLDEVFVWGRNADKVKTYITDMEKKTDLTFTMCSTPSESVKNADIIVTTTTSEVPLFNKEDVKPGTHIACIGADTEGKQEIDEHLFKGNKVVVDSLEQCRTLGEVQHALKQGLISDEDVHGEIGDIILGKEKGRETEEEVTIFDSTGLSIQDITTAKKVSSHVQASESSLKIDLI